MTYPGDSVLFVLKVSGMVHIVFEKRVKAVTLYINLAMFFRSQNEFFGYRCLAGLD